MRALSAVRLQFNFQWHFWRMALVWWRKWPLGGRFKGSFVSGDSQRYCATCTAKPMVEMELARSLSQSISTAARSADSGCRDFLANV